MCAEEIRRAIETATRSTLPTITALLWRAYGEERITEAEAEALSVLIELRQRSVSGQNVGQGSNPTGTLVDFATEAPQDRQGRPRTSAGSRPRTDASLERRRRWAASGRLPPAIAARFTLAEQAALAVIAAETAKRGDCRMGVKQVAGIAGVSETTVRNAVREAQKLHFITVEERRLSAWRNDTNVIRVVSPEWTAWLRLGGKGDRGGCKFAKRTPTRSSNLGTSRTTGEARKRNPDPNPPCPTRLRVGDADPRRGAH